MQTTTAARPTAITTGVGTASTTAPEVLIIDDSPTKVRETQHASHLASAPAGKAGGDEKLGSIQNGDGEGGGRAAELLGETMRCPVCMDFFVCAHSLACGHTCKPILFVIVKLKIR